MTNLALEFVRVTEEAAMAAAKWIGRGDKESADKSAVEAMRKRFNQIEFSGRVVIGEGEKDHAPELYIGEKIGKGGGSLYDIAVDPLECTSSVAFGRQNALCVIAAGPEGSLFPAVDSYMEKIAVGPKARDIVDLDASVSDNIKKVARVLAKDVSEITVAVLDRPRHEDLVKKIRESGARVQLFTDGDIAMALAPCLENSPIDILMGVGGSTEAVLTASALKCLGGQLLCRWKPKDEFHTEKLHKAGIIDFNKIFTAEDLAKGKDIAFTATGVISGPLLEGVIFRADKIIAHSVIMLANPRTVRFVETHYKH